MKLPRLISICLISYLLVTAACTVAGAAVPDPVADPVGSASLVVQLWKGGSLPAALIVAVFLALTVASRKIAWLAQGYAAIVTASILAGLAVIIEPASRGTTPTAGMVIAAIAASVALALKGQGEPVA